MGYDFTFARLDPRPDHFPFRPAVDFDGRLKALKNPESLERCLLSPGGFRHNGPPNNGTQYYWSDTPDGGSLDVCVRDDWVSVDTHAHWSYVLKVYDLLCSIEPELLILDLQSSVFYDAVSFRTFVDESYAQKT